MSTQGDNGGWIRDGHKVTVFVDLDHVRLELIHTFGRCTEDASSALPRDACWLQSWADNVLWEELYIGGANTEKDLSGLTLPAEIEYRPAPNGEGEPEWRFV